MRTVTGVLKRTDNRNSSEYRWHEIYSEKGSDLYKRSGNFHQIDHSLLKCSNL